MSRNIHEIKASTPRGEFWAAVVISAVLVATVLLGVSFLVSWGWTSLFGESFKSTALALFTVLMLNASAGVYRGQRSDKKA